MVTALNYDVLVRTERWGYIARGDGTQARLYDVRVDPGWRTDVAPDYPGETKALHALVEHDAGGRLPVYEGVRDRIASEWYRLS
jgi:hypothetical protein